MILFAEITGQEWVVITSIICGTIAGIFSSLFGYLGAKYGATKAVKENTDITVAAAGAIDAAATAADVAAKHAEEAAGVGRETRDLLSGAAKNARIARDKAEVNEQRTTGIEKQVKELQEESGLLRRKDHFKGDEPK